MRRRAIRVVCSLGVCLLAVAQVAAQVPMGTLTGHVAYADAALPGVTVEAESEALQGAKRAITTETGDYILRALPPGVYSVTFSLTGFRTQTAEVKISAAQTRSLDAIMFDESFAEEILVTSAYETISGSMQGATTFEQDLIEKLAVRRDIDSAVAMSPGVSANGPGLSGISISGAQSYDNLLMINGVVVNENIRGQVLDLFIEDAVQETTTQISGVSAEYGRFQGGVVNTITKSGGNDFSGSFRLNLENDDWLARTPLSPERDDSLNKIYEATFGGFVLKDRLWFFLAGRDTSTSENRATSYTNISYPYSREEQRYEGKLTFSINESHRLIGSYTEIDSTTTNYGFGTFIDSASLNPNRTDPQELWVVNYTGVITESFFAEAQASERTWGVANGAGSPYTDILRGTLLLDQSRGYARYHTPTFCSAPSCQAEERNNEDYLVKGSLFLSSDAIGSHDLTLGFDRFNDIRIQDNHQQGSDFRIYGTDAIIQDGYIYPVFEPVDPVTGEGTFYVWTPIFQLPRATEFLTDSVFVNDSWRYDEHWSFNIGVRYDRNDGTDSSGTKVADDSRFSPRLGVAYDLNGDGDITLRASYGHYVAGITQGVANNAGAGGSPAWVEALYSGPCVNCNGVPEYNQEEAIQIWYDWFLANGGTDVIPGAYYYDLPGFTPKILQSLKSPYTEEYTLGVTKRLGNRGLVRTDYVHREGHDFYATRIDLGTGTVDAGPVGILDLAVITNDDSAYERRYDGLHTQAQYRISDTLAVGGNWTWSHARGNFDGETRNSGPITGSLPSYPEYKEARWNSPYGDLAVDQRHKVRAWLTWDAIATDHHSLTVSVMESFWTGENYSAIRSVDTGSYVTNPGYEAPNSRWDYYFSGRGEYRWDDITRTDLAVNYSFFLNVFGRDIEVFLQPEILNLLNEQGQIGGNSSIRLIGDGFDPFTETPVEGIDWEKGDSFGQPTGEGDYQDPRTFRLSLGVRF